MHSYVDSTNHGTYTGTIDPHYDNKITSVITIAANTYTFNNVTGTTTETTTKSISPAQGHVIRGPFSAQTYTFIVYLEGDFQKQGDYSPGFIAQAPSQICKQHATNNTWANATVSYVRPFWSRGSTYGVGTAAEVGRTFAADDGGATRLGVMFRVNMTTSCDYIVLQLGNLYLIDYTDEILASNIVNKQTADLKDTTGSDSVLSGANQQFQQQFQQLSTVQKLNTITSTITQSVNSTDSDSIIRFPGLSLMGFTIDSYDVDIWAFAPNLKEPCRAFTSFLFGVWFVRYVFAVIEQTFLGHSPKAENEDLDRALEYGKEKGWWGR